MGDKPRLLKVVLILLQGEALARQPGVQSAAVHSCYWAYFGRPSARQAESVYAGRYAPFSQCLSLGTEGERVAEGETVPISVTAATATGYSST